MFLESRYNSSDLCYLYTQSMPMKKNNCLCRIICVLVFAVMWIPASFAASLDDLYAPLLAKNSYLYQAKISHYGMAESGEHGNASFSRFESDPGLVNLSHSLRFSPLVGLDAEIGYGHYFPREYRRSTYDGPTLALDTVQEYTLDYFQNYFLKLRFRRGLFETYIQFQEKRQKAKSDSTLLLNDTVSFDDIDSHYEDLNFGIHYLSQGEGAQNTNSYFQMTRPLLADQQVNVEFNVGFRNGKVKNTSDIFLGSTLFVREYTHQLRPHFIPEVLLRYGISDQIELESGFSYTSPFKYNYQYKQFNATFPNLITGTYTIENNLKAPLKLTYRPTDDLSFSFRSDFNYIKQRLDSWEKENDGSSTIYAVRKVRYYNTQPTLEISYFHQAEKLLVKSEFSSLTKQLLRHEQYLMSFRYQHDITSLKKADGNGTQNIIDPYNVFLYPLEQFVAGTEYGTFLNGNRTTRAAAVSPQNYYVLETSLMVGLSDTFNAGMDIGYRSSNSLHHFTVHDLVERFYRFEPYYYFNWIADWQVKENSLLSFKVHYAPQYKTFLETSADATQFEDETRYYEVSLALKALF